MSFTDYLRLSEQKIFKEACELLPRNIGKPLNLVAVRDSVLFTWDFANNCVLSLNIKAARSKEEDKVTHQKILPLRPPLFSPEFLVVNETGSLLIVAGPNGILVLQLPLRCPPYGAFEDNKELVYCRTHSLDERLLSCSDIVHVRQAKFHPASPNDSHILVLTSDNMLRLYQIEKNEALSVGVYPIGEQPSGMFPGSRTTFLDIYGEIAVDFDFGFPEIPEERPIWQSLNEMTISKKKDTMSKQLDIKGSRSGQKIIPKRLEQSKKEKAKTKFDELIWPVYILRGDFSVYYINIDINRRVKPILKGPCLMWEQPDVVENDACSIICLRTVPQIVSIASVNGTLTNSILLKIDQEEKSKLITSTNNTTDVPDKELLVFETVELELGLSPLQESEDDEDSKKYKCPIFLHKDESKVSRYFATHGAGVHMINLNCVEELHNYVFGPKDSEPTSDIFINPSSVEYLVCTKAANNTKSNPVIGFALYYEPSSIISLLSDRSVVTMGIMTAVIIPKNDSLLVLDNDEDIKAQSPLKKMVNEPFDDFIQKILKKGSSRPLLKLSSTSGNTEEECYELLQRATQTFREEYFKAFTKAGQELEKRVQMLMKLKKDQKSEIDRMEADKDELRDKAEYLAEKYEDIKDKQDELMKKCEQLIMLVSRKKAEPSDAEKKFIKDMKVYSDKCVAYQDAIAKIKNKNKYQQMHIQNWKSAEHRKITELNEEQSKLIKDNLHDSAKKIEKMIKQVNEFKRILNL